MEIILKYIQQLVISSLIEVKEEEEEILKSAHRNHILSAVCHHIKALTEGIW